MHVLKEIFTYSGKKKNLNPFPRIVGLKLEVISLQILCNKIPLKLTQFKKVMHISQNTFYSSRIFFPPPPPLKIICDHLSYIACYDNKAVSGKSY